MSRETKKEIFEQLKRDIAQKKGLQENQLLSEDLKFPTMWAEITSFVEDKMNENPNQNPVDLFDFWNKTYKPLFDKLWEEKHGNI